MFDYETIRSIGAGSFGRALLCKRISTGQQVIIKEINLEEQESSIQQASLQEAKILSMIRHPSIIEYIDSFIEEGKLCIVMEYASGGDLWTKIKSCNGSHFSESQILTWFIQICQALKYVHSQHILHRDIKSQNIFLDAQGNAKLGDFGIAKILNHTRDFAHSVVGSPFYLSPEICQGLEYNSKTDVWSLGCVLYELCTFSPAFSGNNMGGIVMKILRQQQPSIPGIYSSDLQILVDAMLQKQPGRRPTISQILSYPFLRKYNEPYSVDVEIQARPDVPVVKPVKKAKKQRIRKSEMSPLQITPATKVVAPVRNSRPKSARPKSKQQLIPKKKQSKLTDGDSISNFLMVKPIQAKSKENVKPIDELENVVKLKHPIKEEHPKEEESIDELEMCIKLEKSDVVSTDSFNTTAHDIECIRAYLESLLGTEKLLQVYNALNSDNSCESEVREMLGKNSENTLVLVQRLIISEEQCQL